MPTWVYIALVVLACWVPVSFVVGVGIGRAAKMRDTIGVRATVHGACQAEREKEAL